MDLRMVVDIPDSKVRGANVGPTWVLSAPDWPHVWPWALLSEIVQFLCPKSTEFSRGLSYCDETSFLTWPAVNMDVSKIEIKRARYCDAISNRWWRHQRNVNRASQTRVDLREAYFYLHVWVYYVFHKWNNATAVTNGVRIQSSVMLVYISLVASQLGK